MLEELNIPASRDTPMVRFDEATSVFEVKGISFPEDVRIFYGPLLYWLNEYSLQPHAHTTFHFQLAYFNTASSKLILDMMLCLNKMHKKGVSLEIVWHFDDEDEDMEDCGLGFSGILQAPFRMEEHKTMEAPKLDFPLGND